MNRLSTRPRGGACIDIRKCVAKGEFSGAPSKEPLCFVGKIIFHQFYVQVGKRSGIRATKAALEACRNHLSVFSVKYLGEVVAVSPQEAYERHLMEVLPYG